MSALAGAASAADTRGDNPFLGLRRFEIEDSALFFGRNDQSYDLLRRLDALHFVAVIGPSGCGKSSLVRAGVLAALQQGYLEDGGSWKIVGLQPGDAPVHAWTSALSPYLKPGARADQLVSAPLEALDTSHGRIVILVDQFEELFQFADRTRRRDEVAAFLRAMLSTGAPDGGIYVLLTMRSEYLLQCAEHVELAAAINEGLYLVPRMTREQMRQAIVGPLQEAGAAIAVELLERLLDDAEREEDGLPVLQHALMRMWPLREPYAPLGKDLYPDGDGLGALLDRHAEAVYESLSATDRGFAEALFRSITERTRDGRTVRRAGTLSAIAEVIGVSPGELEPVIAAFAAEGFLLRLPAAGSPLIDIPHEAVARRWKRLVGWIDNAARERFAIQAVKDAAKEWQDNGRGKSYLFGGRKLRAVGSDLGRSILSFTAGSIEREFLDNSARVDGWARLLSPRVLAGVAGVLAALVTLAVWVIVTQRDAALAQAAAAAKVAQESKKALDSLRLAQAAESQAQAAKSQARAAETLTIEPTIKDRSTAAPATLPRLYPQVWNADQGRLLKSIVDRLGQKTYTVLPVQRVSVGPDANELRYFRKAERETAERIAQDFAKQLPVNVVYVAGYEQSTSIRDNHFELWLAKPQAAAAPAGQPVVVVLFQGEALRADAQQISDALGTGYDTSAQPYGGAVTWNFVAPAEVHYFRRQDDAEAEKIAQAIRARQPAVVARFMPVSSTLPPRYFEIWLRAS